MKHIHTLPPILLIGLLLTLSSLPTVQAATNCAAVTEIPPAQCDTLLALYNSTDGANWTDKTNWKVTNTPCSWKGITCNGGNVTNISLASNNLKGSLPTLSALTGLQILDLSWNQLTGTLPNLSMLIYLQVLHLQYNQFTGSILDWSKLTKLWNLHLSDNQLTGTIPNWSMLTSLQVLILNNNQLTGTIPDVSKLTSLQRFYLNNNQLTGTLPNWSQLTNLRYIIFNNNQLTGTLPDLSKLTNLLYLGLAGNQLTGTLPDWSKLTNLQNLYLNDNQLTGTIPDWSMLTDLRNLYLSRNQLTGTIPDWSKLTNLRNLYLSNNQLTGTIPDWSKLTSLPNLALNNNQLTGSIPEWNMLTNLQMLYLAANQLSGPIPSLNTLTKLTTLVLSSNPQLCRDPKANYGTRTEVNSFSLCGSTPVQTPVENQLTVTISKSGIGTGEVKTADTKINCGTTCQNDFSANTAVTLFAISSAGSTFTGWSGDCAGTDTSITLTLDVAKTCVANFATVPTNTVENCPTTPVDTGVTLPNTGPDLGAVNSSETISSSVPLPEYPFCAQVTEIPKAQCQTLLAIYDNTAGTTWTHQDGWNTTTTPCQWYGVECTIGQVTALRLANNNLQGTLPTLAALTFLKQLAVEDNLLKGTLSGLPTTLEIFTGDRNQLSGPLTVVQTLTQLRQLNLSDNQFSDALPDLSLLTRLEILNLNNNQLAGPIPDLRKLTQLKQLLLKDNHLAGAIPALTVADTLDLSGNDQLCRDINLTYTQPALNAYPPCTYPTLTVAKTGSGIGLVSATSPTDQDELNCGLECLQTDQTYSPDSNVTVTATPTEGTVFTGWSGECNGTTETLTVTLDQAKTCVANFDIKDGYYELQVSKTGIGKGTVTTSNKNDPFHCDTKCQETRGTYPANTQVKLWTSASKGSEFTGWGGACSGIDPRLTLTMDQAKSCYANFNLKEPPPPAMRQLIINTDAGSGKGTVTTDREDTEKQGIDCGIDCLENYQNGKYVKLTATPLPGSSFLSWEDDCSGKDPTLTVKMTDNKLCTALFANDIEMNAAETVSDFYTNGYLDTGEEVQDRYPRYPDNDQRLREAFFLAQPAILTVDLQVDLDNLEATWPLQFNIGLSFFRLQPAGVYTESVKILKDAIVEGYLSPALVVGYYVEVRVKLLNYLGEEEWVPILTYYGDAPTIEEVAGARSERNVRQLLKGKGIAINPPPICGSACKKPPRK